MDARHIQIAKQAGIQGPIYKVEETDAEITFFLYNRPKLVLEKTPHDPIDQTVDAAAGPGPGPGPAQAGQSPAKPRKSQTKPGKSQAKAGQGRAKAGQGQAKGQAVTRPAAAKKTDAAGSKPKKDDATLSTVDRPLEADS
jgi:hypothetical protein